MLHPSDGLLNNGLLFLAAIWFLANATRSKRAAIFVADKNFTVTGADRTTELIVNYVATQHQIIDTDMDLC